jgi:Na+-transporting methylmalonyl-CoA/oxaloacetate decarboxylase gamma subunit
MNQITQSLLITGIGMGLVFILIILLWGFMAALVSITNRWDFMAKIEEGEAVTGEDNIEKAAEPSKDIRDIIAVAVATAMVSDKKTGHIVPVQSGGISNWQAVTRANTLAQISSIFNRKPRG